MTQVINVYFKHAVSEGNAGSVSAVLIGSCCLVAMFWLATVWLVDSVLHISVYQRVLTLVNVQTYSPIFNLSSYNWSWLM